MTKKQFLVTGDGSHTIFLPELNETYHSTHGAIQESRHVFIDRGLDFLAQSGRSDIRILEVGFGTGLNALLSWMYAEKNRVNIQYTTIEAFPLDQEDIVQLNYARQLGEPAAAEKFAQLHHAAWDQWEALSGYFKIKKVKGLVQEVIFEGQVDICYFDAFAPSKQPEMWDISILGKTAESLGKKGIFVTYCAKGQLKRDLKSLGLEVESLAGPPGKKEMVRAIKI